MCRACLDSPSVKRAVELGSWWREVPFMINHARDGEAAERAPLTNGRVDLVFRDGDELVVVDYKTDKDVTEGDRRAVRAQAPRRPERGLRARARRPPPG